VTIGSGFADVLTAAKAGGEWAWERLFTSVERQLRGYLVAQGAADPENMAGDVLLGAVAGISGFEGDERQFRSWVFVMAHHRLVDERRRDRRRENLTRFAPRCEQIADAGADVLERLGASEWMARLDQLSNDQRSVVLLRIVAGLSTEETAVVLGKRPGAVRVMQHRALGRLREILSAEVTL
jgi:RNA polymerase sigma factor (sigma-70 family)